MPVYHQIEIRKTFSPHDYINAIKLMMNRRFYKRQELTDKRALGFEGIAKRIGKFTKKYHDKRQKKRQK